MWWGRYVGTPFGEGPGQMTCWSLVRDVYSNFLGVDLPSYGEISARDLAAIARQMRSGKDDGWVAVEKPDPFDVVLMRSGRGGNAIVHVGVAIDRTRLLHIEEATAAVVVPMAHFSVAGRIMGFRRLS